MGAAGDMLSSALFELIDDKTTILKEIEEIRIPQVEFNFETANKCGITGTHLTIKVNGEEEDEHLHDHHHEHDHHDHHHHHSSLKDIEDIVNGLRLEDKVKQDVLAIYKIIAEAESHVHNVPITDIHFHEVGTMDAVADITISSFLLNKINPEKIVASPIDVGSGQVKCAHGILPVPAPATAFILQGIPMYESLDIKGELCTPTGAAILKHFVNKFEQMPIIKTEKIGYGMGKKDFPKANAVRMILGETDKIENTVTELTFNIDDMTPEMIGLATELFFVGGALDVYTTPVVMKKNRPGFVINVMCKDDKKDEMIELIFKHTTTLGVRENISKRYTLERQMETVEIDQGVVRKKIATGYGASRYKYEYDDIVKIVKEHDLSYNEVIDLLNKKSR